MDIVDCGLWIWRQQHQWADVKKATILHKRPLLETGKCDITATISILLTSNRVWCCCRWPVDCCSGCLILCQSFFFSRLLNHLNSKKSATTNPKLAKLTLIPYYYLRTNYENGEKIWVVFFLHWDSPSINAKHIQTHTKYINK